jgi:hypothetical protein
MLHAQVLKTQGREDLAEEAEAALAVLLAALVLEATLEAARAARIAESQARTAAFGRPKSIAKRKSKEAPRRSQGVESAPCIPR